MSDHGIMCAAINSVLSSSFYSFIDIDHMADSELNSEFSLPSESSSHTSDGSLSMSSSESSYNSDQSSGNEEGQDSGYVVYEESSDEIDFLVV